MACQNAVFSRTPVAIAMTMALTGTAGMAQANDAYDLGEIVVTASRTAQSVDETLAPVSVITREDIEKKSSNLDFTEFLKTVPGVSVSSNGGPGATTSLSLFEELVLHKLWYWLTDSVLIVPQQVLRRRFSI